MCFGRDHLQKFLRSLVASGGMTPESEFRLFRCKFCDGWFFVRITGFFRLSFLSHPQTSLSPPRLESLTLEQSALEPLSRFVTKHEQSPQIANRASPR